MEKVKVNLKSSQLLKLKNAIKNKKSVIIQFSIDQFIDGKDTILLTKRQFNKLEKHKKLNKGLRIELSHMSGGLLKDILELAEDLPVVNKVVPYVRKASPIVKKDIIPIVRNILDWLDKELSDVTGSGLDVNTLKYVRKNLKKNFNH